MRKLLYKISLFVIGIALIDYGMSSLLYKGLIKYTDINMDADVVFVGHSHTQCAIDIPIFQDHFAGRVKATKLAMHGINLSNRLTLLKYYFKKTRIKPKVVVFDIDETILSSPANNLNTHTRFYPFMDDPDVGKYIAENVKDPWAVAARNIVRTLRYNNSWILIRAIKGSAGIVDNKASDRTIDNIKDILSHSYPVRIDTKSELLLHDTIDYLKKQNVSLVFAYYPRLMANTIDIANHREVSRRVQTIAGSVPHRFLDFNDDYGSRYDVFSDTTHLNRKGQKLLSGTIAEDLRPILISP